MTTQNPYAAPAPPDARTARRSRKNALAHGRLKQFYFASLLAPLGFAMVGRGTAPLLFGLLSMLAWLGGVVAFCAWWRHTWANLSARDQRGTSPAAAVAYLFVPGVGLVWQFMAAQRIVRALDAKLVKYPTRVRAPSTVAFVAPALSSLSVLIVVVSVLFGRQLPGVTLVTPFILLTPFVWYGWMTRVDMCAAEVLYQRSEKKRRKREAEEVVTATDS